MKLELYRGTKSQQEKEERLAILRSAPAAMDILRELLEARKADVMENLLKKKWYDLPGWSERQADLVGEARAYQEILELITLDQREGKQND